MHSLDVDDIKRRYLIGESARDIADSLGVEQKAILRRLRKACVPIRDVSTARLLAAGHYSPDPAMVVKIYSDGWSEKAVADYMEVSRCLIRKILISAKVPIRGRSSAATLRLQQIGKEGRLRLTEAAHAAVRGVPQSEEYRQRVAAGRQERQTQCSTIERRFCNRFAATGIEIVQQLAIGRYNVDVAIAGTSIAVEILGGHWHGSGRHARVHRQRTDYLLDRGWTPVFIWVTEDYPLDDGALDYLIALHEAFCLQEPARREEHVIRGDGCGGPISEGYPIGIPIIPCYKGCPNRIGHDRRTRQ